MSYVLIPAVPGMLAPDTADAVMVSGLPWLLDCLPPGDDQAYARMMLAVWRQALDVFVVEQDTVPPPGALFGMDRCEAPWCAVPHAVGGAPSLDTLGCTKICAEIMRAHPDLARVALGGFRLGEPLVHWRRVAPRLCTALSTAGYNCHPHRGQTVHLNPLYRKAEV